MEKNIKKMNETLKGLYQEKKITFSEWERTLKWYVSDNKIRSEENMTEKNISRKIKDAVDNNKNKKVKSQIDRGFMIAKKWKQQGKDKETVDKILFPEGQQEE